MTRRTGLHRLALDLPAWTTRIRAILVLARRNEAHGEGDADHAGNFGPDWPHVLHEHAAQASPVEYAGQRGGADAHQCITSLRRQFAHRGPPTSTCRRATTGAARMLPRSSSGIVTLSWLSTPLASLL